MTILQDMEETGRGQEKQSEDGELQRVRGLKKGSWASGVLAGRGTRPVVRQAACYVTGSSAGSPFTEFTAEIHFTATG